MLKLPRKLKLRTLGDEALRQHCTPITHITDDIAELAEMMVEGLDRFHGVGLAANQVGFPIRMIAVDAPEPTPKELKARELTPGEKLLFDEMPTILINPEIVSMGEELIEYEEGCLSLPKIYGKVIRPANILLKAQFIDGEDFVAEVGGFTARILQHEIDHLNGLVYADRMTEKEYARIAPELESLKIQKEAEALKRKLKKK